MPSLSPEGKSPLNELLAELIEQLVKTSQLAGALTAAGSKKEGPAKATSSSPAGPQNIDDQASTNIQNEDVAATTIAQNVTADAVVEGEDETADADIAGGNVTAENEEDETKFSLSPLADTEEPPSVTDFINDKDSDGVFDAYQALVEGTEKAQTSQEKPAPDQELGGAGSGPSFPGVVE